MTGMLMIIENSNELSNAAFVIDDAMQSIRISKERIREKINVFKNEFEDTSAGIFFSFTIILFNIT